jgi:phosphatidate phosphatase APP1
MGVKIDAFTGYGTPDLFTVAGRVSKDGGKLSSLNAEFDRMGWAKKLRRNARRFLLPEMQGVALEVVVAGARRETVTEAHGHFKVKFQGGPILQPGITTYSVRIHEREDRYDAIKSVGQVVINSSATSMAVISDIDDTIVASHIHNKLRMIIHAIFTNVSDLRATPGFSALFNAVHIGRSGLDARPLFYVSGSPANLYDKLHAFLRANRFPIGPLFLTKIGRGADQGFFQSKIFKTERIRELFLQFPHFRFILIGDNTQTDSEIYHQMALEFPGRVGACLIYERIPRLIAGKILPLGQHRISSALEGGLVLYRKGLISKDGLQLIVNEMILADALPESFNLERQLRKLERRENNFVREFSFWSKG